MLQCASMQDEVDLKEIILDSERAREQFELFERLYLCLSEKAEEYLRNRSGEYKSVLTDIRDMVQPAITRNYSICKESCCLLCIPESLYTASSVGGFGYIDYLLVRCDTVLPEPCYENVRRNMCPFWSDGCILPGDCRSFTCTRYFCDKLKDELDMNLVSEHLDKAQCMIDSFSIRTCMAYD